MNGFVFLLRRTDISMGKSGDPTTPTCQLLSFKNTVLREFPCIAQASLKLMILLPQPPKCWGYKCREANQFGGSISVLAPQELAPLGCDPHEKSCVYPVRGARGWVLGDVNLRRVDPRIYRGTRPPHLIQTRCPVTQAAGDVVGAGLQL